MTTSTTGSSKIYTGPWVNHEHGPIVGATITLSSLDSQLLTAFLSFFVTLVGASLWKIITFTLHQARSSAAPADGLHHQQQVIFRNTTSAAGSALEFAHQIWAWRKNVKSSFLRTAPWMLFAVLYMLVFAILSVFSGYEITRAPGDARLVRTTAQCGYWVSSSSDSESAIALTDQDTKSLNDSTIAANYARQCYTGTSELYNSLQCSTYKVPAIEWITNNNVTCPFGDNICVTTNSTNTLAYEMDTGLLDSTEIFGINAPENERIQFRKVTTCAPIHEKTYTIAVNLTEELQSTYPGTGAIGDAIILYNYGPLNFTGATANYTYAYNEHLTFTNTGYSLSSFFKAGNSTGDGLWEPIPAMQRIDADVTMVFIAPNAITFVSPNDDPVFGASEVVANYTLPDGTEVFAYTSNLYNGIITCTDQYQMCNPNNGACTPLVGESSFSAESYKTEMNYGQEGAMFRFLLLLDFLSVSATVGQRGAQALVAQETVSTLSQKPIPNNQWQLEVSSWFAASLARLQRGIYEFAAGTENVGDGNITLLATGGEELVAANYMCNNQMVRSAAGTINFSLLGLALIIGIGGLIILVALVLDIVVGFVQARILKRGQHAKLNWILDDKMQLQRMMYEGLGMGGTWEQTMDIVPVSEKHIGAFGGWGAVNEENPRLSQMVFGGRDELSAEPNVAGDESQEPFMHKGFQTGVSHY